MSHWAYKSLLSEQKKGVDLDGNGSGEDLGGVEGSQTTISIYCINTLFSIKEK